MTREILVVTHPRRSVVRESAHRVIEGLAAAGVSPRVLRDEAEMLDLTAANSVPHDADAAVGVELVLVLGGDGSLLRGAELARTADAPLLGVNLGHVGFLAEAEPDALESTIEHVVRKDYTVEERMTVDVTVRRRGEVTYTGWALNEMSLEKAERARMLECVLEIDGRPLSRWGCDGVICSTPTGSTAYAFSVGGPVMWPGVEALLVAPISAHALFARPLVLAPTSAVAVEILPPVPAVLYCDGRRSVEVPPESRVEVVRGRRPVRLAVVHPLPFTDRLVAKFGLPVEGWRGRNQRASPA
ncbi:putative sugar kinase [Frankia casuarinae]|uniref:NAD kinase n=1 Tax=Frankia casuarinae (strain DSM 45818 / CECT 9043 / HFP020203 / CcI3) TaxID=106370 RepID=Q2J876_FRACC|nr:MULTISPECIES: NAD kinase [Frankia]ABD12516.1 NAD(+) kinase [Frankia casuarinae]ESZ99842.1 putative sugar kinase [Frankia sp. CcI6]EYT90261.1 putative sugar kinase [Frankia casuarinae]KDA42301.1 putative sugar kinase [Frankia sp. BMG5.23]OHV52678.1 NAD kinase [Frankia sp. CgIS1]